MAWPMNDATCAGVTGAQRRCLRLLACLMGLTVAYGAPAARAAAEPGDRAAAQLKRRSERFFKSNDRNGDGKLTPEEFPPGVRRMFERIDVDNDGFVTQEENMAFRRAMSERQSPGGEERDPLPQPDFADVRYGTHERNVLDVWQTDGDGPAPLVIYYHGGGFRGGDKRRMDPALLKGLLGKGITVAGANYRLTDTAPFPAQMHDCARALQFLRHNAAEYKIEPTRVGATGGSAGAGISMWLAFHDDLARPDSDDPVARQSTRLSVAVVYAAQSSYDPRFIKELFDTEHVEGALVKIFGMRSPEDVDDPEFHPLFEEASAINHVTKDDVPVMLFYPQPNTPLPKNSSGGQHIHHPEFGIVLKEKMDELGVPCTLKFNTDYDGPGGGQRRIADYVAFFCRHLGVEETTDAARPQQ